MIELKCTSCGAGLRVSEGKAGELGQCPHCQAVMEIPPVAASTGSAKPKQTAKPKPPAKGAKASSRAASGGELEALQQASAKPAKESKTRPDSRPRPSRESRSPKTIIDRDGIPVAKAIEERPLWLKVTIASAAGLLILAAVLVITLSGDDPEDVTPPDETLVGAQKLYDEGMAIDRWLVIRGLPDEPGKLLDWKRLLKEATAKYDEALSLGDTKSHKSEQLEDLLTKVTKRKAVAAKRIVEVENDLWPIVSEGDQSQEMYDRVSPAIPIVKQARGQGSGFLLEHKGKLWVVTNMHVVRGAGKGKLEIRFPMGDPRNPSWIPVRVPWQAVEVIHSQTDLALISLAGIRSIQDFVSRKQLRPLKLLSDRMPRVLEKVWTVGHPKSSEGIELTATEGSICAIRELGEKLIQIDAKITFGSSGGPVFDRYGRVVGVAFKGVVVKGAGGVKDIEKYAVHVDMLWELLNKPEVRLSADDTQRVVLGVSSPDPANVVPGANQPDPVEVAAAYARYRKQMEKDGWQLCQSKEARHRLWIFQGRARTQYAILAVSDPQHQLGLIVRSTAREVGRRDKRGKTARLAVGFRLDADLICGVLVRDDTVQSMNWPVHVGVFRRAVSPAPGADELAGKMKRVEINHPGFKGVCLVHLPVNYTENRSWPVIFAYPDARGVPNVETFRKLTKARDYIIVGLPYVQKAVASPPAKAVTLDQFNQLFEPESNALGTIFLPEICRRFRVERRLVYVGGTLWGGAVASVVFEDKADSLAGLILLRSRRARGSFPPSDPGKLQRNKVVFIGYDPDSRAESSHAKEAERIYVTYGVNVTRTPLAGSSGSTLGSSARLAAWLGSNGPLKLVKEDYGRAAAALEEGRLGAAYKAFAGLGAISKTEAKCVLAAQKARQLKEGAEQLLRKAKEAEVKKDFLKAETLYVKAARLYDGSQFGTLAARHAQRLKETLGEEIERQKIDAEATAREAEGDLASERGDYETAISIYSGMLQKHREYRYIKRVRDKLKALRASPDVEKARLQKKADSECPFEWKKATVYIANERFDRAVEVLRGIVKDYPETTWARKAQAELSKIQQ